MLAAKKTLPPPYSHARTHAYFPRILTFFGLSQKPSQVIPQAAGGESLARIAIVTKKREKRKM